MDKNCAECNSQFSYTPPTGFADNRKYCDKCSALKKAAWDNKPVPAPVNKPVKEFHLSPEQVRTNALTMAIKWVGVGKADVKTGLIELARQFETYLLNG